MFAKANSRNHCINSNNMLYSEDVTINLKRVDKTLVHL